MGGYDEQGIRYSGFDERGYPIREQYSPPRPGESVWVGGQLMTAPRGTKRGYGGGHDY